MCFVDSDKSMEKSLKVTRHVEAGHQCEQYIVVPISDETHFRAKKSPMSQRYNGRERDRDWEKDTYFRDAL